MEKDKHTEEAQTRETVPRLDWNMWDAILFVILAPFAALAILVILAPTQWIAYLSGRFDLPLDALVFFILSVPGTPLLLSLPFLVLSVPLVFIGTMRLLAGWKGYTSRKRCVRTAQIGISVFAAIVLALSGFVPIKPYSPAYKPFMSGFADRMISKTDTEAIRDWLKTVPKERCTGETLDSYPSSVAALKPRYVSLDLDDNGNSKVRLTWGGGFGHWGVEIGMQDMRTPPSDFSRFGEYRLSVQPGMYVWLELQ
jgi:hypothetical protein